MRQIEYSHTAALRKALRVGIIGGLNYFIVITIIHLINAEITYSTLPDWIYRLTILLSVIVSIWTYRLKLSGRITFFQGFLTGIFTGFVLCLVMGGSTYIFRTAIAPEYDDKSIDIYAKEVWGGHAIQFMKNQKITALKDAPLDAKMELVYKTSYFVAESHYFFTTAGGIVVILIFTNLWTLAIAFSVAYMSQGVKKNTSKIQGDN